MVQNDFPDITWNLWLQGPETNFPLSLVCGFWISIYTKISTEKSIYTSLAPHVSSYGQKRAMIRALCRNVVMSAYRVRYLCRYKGKERRSGKFQDAIVRCPFCRRQTSSVFIDITGSTLLVDTDIESISNAHICPTIGCRSEEPMSHLTVSEHSIR